MIAVALIQNVVKLRLETKWIRKQASCRLPNNYASFYTDVTEMCVLGNAQFYNKCLCATFRSLMWVLYNWHFSNILQTEWQIHDLVGIRGAKLLDFDCKSRGGNFFPFPPSSFSCLPPPPSPFPFSFLPIWRRPVGPLPEKNVNFCIAVGDLWRVFF